MNDKIERSPRQEKQKPLHTLGGTPSLPLVTVDSAREALESHKINGVESKTLRKKSKATDTAYLDATIVRDLDLTFCSPPHRARSRMHLRRYVHVFRRFILGHFCKPLSSDLTVGNSLCISYSAQPATITTACKRYIH